LVPAKTDGKNVKAGSFTPQGTAAKRKQLCRSQSRGKKIKEKPWKGGTHQRVGVDRREGGGGGVGGQVRGSKRTRKQSRQDPLNWQGCLKVLQGKKNMPGREEKARETGKDSGKSQREENGGTCRGVSVGNGGGGGN